MSSPSFDSRADPQQGQRSGAAMATRSRGRCVGNGRRAGRLRSNAATASVDTARRPLVFACRGLEFLQLELHLVQEPRLALRAAAVELAPQLLDRELQVRN